VHSGFPPSFYNTTNHFLYFWGGNTNGNSLQELRTQIENIIKKAIGLEDDDTKILLDHILSRRIGVKKISDLEEMAIENLPSGLLGEIPAKRLIKAFHKAAQGTIV